MVAAVFKGFQIPLQSGDQLFVQVLAALLPGKLIGKVIAEAGNSAGMQSGQGFRHRQDGDGVGIFAAALGLGIEETHGIQFIAKEFTAEGLILAGGENVQNAATQGKLTHAFHHGAAAVAQLQQAGNQVSYWVFLSNGHGEGSFQQGVFRNGTQAQGFPGKDLHRGLSLGQVIQLAQTLLLPGTGDHCRIVKGQISAGEDGKHFPQKAFQFFLDPFGSQIVLADHHQRTAALVFEACKQVAAVDLTNAGDGGAFAFFQCRQG